MIRSASARPTVFVLLAAALASCSEGGPASTRESAQAGAHGSSAPLASVASTGPASASPSVPSSAPPSPAASASGAPVALGPFVALKRPEPGAGEGADQCAFTGGMGAACSSAYAASTDEVVKRYMLRTVEANASLARPELERDPAEVGGPPHAEVGLGCKDTGPCGPAEGYPCLTRAWAELAEGEPKKSEASHARACKCDSAGARIPVMAGIGVLACDGDKPVKLGALPKSEAEEILACATCDPEKGPAACERELTRLRVSDAELATYLEKTHLARCRAGK